ncbi:MAG: toxin TcdB middle/N-terminal domain-containing protein, partial [Myxococcota bacterium]
VQHLARDTGTDKAWTLKLPHPMLVVDRTDTYDTLTNVHEITEYMYHDGFYDGVEKQFRGFAMTEIRQLGDTTQEEGLTELLFDVGATDPYRNGLQLEQTTFSYPHNAPPTSNTEKMAHALMRSTSTYEDCAIAEVPTPTEMDAAGQLPARWLCHTANVDVEMEKAPQSEWVRKESFTHYDGYGNTIRTENLGVVSIGDGACQPCTQDPDTFGAPCGNTCMGDEHYTETDYIVPGELTDGRWLLGQPYRERTFGREGSEWVTETLIYYDGPDFEGLPLGQLTHGNVSRTTQKVAVGSDDVINAVRNRYDEHGNVVETLDPNGDPAEHRHRRRYGYDADNLLVTQTEILLKDPEGHPYTLRRDVQYSPQWDKPIESTAWMLIHNGQEPDAAARRATYYEYDNFGRLSGKRLPGALHELSEVYHYELANPSSRIRIQKRSTLGGPLDLEVARCMDGKGRTYQTRTRLAEGSWQVDGLKVFNVRGSEWRVYQPYLDTHAACETLLPDDVRYTDYRRDGQYRLLEMIEPDAELYGGQPSVSRTVYAPLMTMAWDPEDSDPDSPHFETPTIQTTNGLGQLVAIDRTLEAQASPARYTLQYDPLGRMTGYSDPDGNTKVQSYDLLGRITHIHGPNMGTTTFTYDDAGNTLTTTDARGITTRTDYDGANRPVARYAQDNRDNTLITFTYDQRRNCPAGDCTWTPGVLAESSYPLDLGDGDVKRGSDWFGYDIRGRQVYTARNVEGAHFAFSFDYDNADRLVATTYPNGQVLQRRYDDASRLIAIDGIVHTMDYTERGLPHSMGCADGSSTTLTYDARLRPSALTTTNTEGDILQGFTYQRDRAGNLL